MGAARRYKAPVCFLPRKCDWCSNWIPLHYTNRIVTWDANGMVCSSLKFLLCCCVPLSFLIPLVLGDLHSDCIFNMRYKLFKSDFLWSLKMEIKESVYPQQPSQHLFLSARAQLVEKKAHISAALEPRKWFCPSRFVFLSSVPGATQSSRNRAWNRTNAFCFKWMVEYPRGKSSPEEPTSVCNKILHRRGITSC